MQQPSGVLIVDGKALCYAAYYKTRYNVTKRSVVFQFFSELQIICRRTRTAHVCFCWDSKKSLRKRIFPGYKKGREHSKDTEVAQVFPQFEEIQHGILPRLGFVNNFLSVGLEADDLIASLCLFPGPQDDQLFTIASHDHDLYQLLCDRVQMYELRKGKIYTNKDFVAQYKVSPLFWAHVKAMAGCSSDNVPGIYGVGEATACQYMCTYQEMEKPHPKIDSSEGKEIIKRNLPLVRLPFSGTPKLSLNWSVPPSFKEWLAFCRENGFSDFLKDTRVWKSICRGVPPEDSLYLRLSQGREKRKINIGRLYGY